MRSTKRPARPPVRNRIREVRQQKGITQVWLAARAGISREALRFIEIGTYEPGIGVALLLARALKVSVTRLFSVADPAAALAAIDKE